ncbi:hypothetical protein ACPOL_3639 [Acidisarcina polymorpha]|uniref:IPT/TIG domain-containing protein n=1 Tax=Acidisarcina polymorpha TaxID=2211140 RepID=A0A2Z5G1H8_9BACT|nr:DUF1800 family protein [Acidisarcina polymorpha]AXC12922.1 hypothetical protein ACPOL_3639 [Acidisarcina polymorpha]
MIDRKSSRQKFLTVRTLLILLMIHCGAPVRCLWASVSSTPAATRQTIRLVADDVDGTNTGTGRLGVAITLSAIVTGTAHQVVAWRVEGGGSLAASGSDAEHAIYTPPLTMPTGQTVTITAYLKTLPSVTTSYTITLLNPVPSIAASRGVTPTTLLVGGTQKVFLAGSGFVPGMTALAGGTVLPVTYKDYNDASVEVPVSATASGTLSLQVENPSPGGGRGTAVAVPVATPAITLTARDGDGTNTGTADLTENVDMAAAVSGSLSTAVTWAVTGSGSISTAGIYMPPSLMPTDRVVTIRASLAVNPAITATYTLSLVNPAPTISASLPAQTPAGTTTTLNLTGTGFVPGTTVATSQGTVTATYQSPTSMVAQLTVPETASGTVLLRAQNPAPGGGTGAALQVSVWIVRLTATNSDGVNSGTARLGVPVNLTATSKSGTHKVIAWVLHGPGTLTPSGSDANYAVYVPPVIMPANANVSIGVSMLSYPSVDASYSMTLINPVPGISAANGVTPSQLLTGGTQPVALLGTGFVPGMTVAVNGTTTVPTAFTDYNHASAQIPVAANATGSVFIQLQNPGPGGGAGAGFNVAVAQNTIALTASNAVGENTVTAALGTTVTMTAMVAGSEQTAVTWSVNGAGSISSGGIYSAPAALPTATLVTVNAALTSNPAITASYQLSVINPTPVISSMAPYEIPAGETTAVTLNGSGFVPSTVIFVNNTAVNATYLSATTMIAQMALPAGASGNISVQGQNPLPGGGAGPQTQEAIVSPISATAAARILDQTTFGPTAALIGHVQQKGVAAWLEEQFNTPMTSLADVPLPTPVYCIDADICAESEWWRAVLTGNDQLRQRVAFALSELFVVSTNNVEGRGITNYANIFANDAFGNWSTIMRDVTLSPAMSIYLNMLNSRKAIGTQIANENFARENMQLFNLGLYLLNQDGSQQLDGSGNPIPTYTEAEVQAFARIFTGWTFANPDGSIPGDLIGTANYYHPLVPIERWHDTSAKTLLNGEPVNAGQSAEQDLAQGLANVFEHPNLPPFVCTQLIKHLVTSNPSPGYISRVAAVFINNGNNVRGDMKAVLTAILTDPEARAGDSEPAVDGGHLREPILWMTAVMRGLGVVSIDPNDDYHRLSDYSLALSEVPYSASSVFNFYPPSYTIADPLVTNARLSAPEFALENTGSVMDRLTLADHLLNNRIISFNVDLSATSPLGHLASNPDALIDRLSLIFLHANIDSYSHTTIKNAISSLKDMSQRVRIAAFLVIGSSSYKILN